jgi:hypothetical protein
MTVGRNASVQPARRLWEWYLAALLPAAKQIIIKELLGLAPYLLLQEATVAGLTVKADGDRLVIRGPREAEELARILLLRKAELLPLCYEREAACSMQQLGVVAAGGQQSIDAAHSLLVDLERAGHSCRVEGNSFLVSQPTKLTPALRQAIVAQEPQLVALMRSEASQVAAAAAGWLPFDTEGPAMVLQWSTGETVVLSCGVLDTIDGHNQAAMRGMSSMQPTKTEKKKKGTRTERDFFHKGISVTAERL